VFPRNSDTLECIPVPRGTRVQYVRKSADHGYTRPVYPRASAPPGHARQHNAAIYHCRAARIGPRIYTIQRRTYPRIADPLALCLCGYNGLPCPTHSDTRARAGSRAALQQLRPASGPATLGSIGGCVPEPHGYTEPRPYPRDSGTAEVTEVCERGERGGAAHGRRGPPRARLRGGHRPCRRCLRRTRQPRVG
jgi:hypothetical protein